MKLRHAVIAGFTAVAMPFLAATPAQAGAGEWDYRGWSYFEYHSSTDSFLSSVVNSGGGNFKFCVHDIATSGSLWFNLKEYDASNADEQIGGYFLSDGQCGILSVDAYGDGTNGTPEVYVETSRISTSAWVEYYD